MKLIIEIIFWLIWFVFNSVLYMFVTILICPFEFVYWIITGKRFNWRIMQNWENYIFSDNYN